MLHSHSLQKDINDRKALDSPEWRHYPKPGVGGHGQHVPFFFTRTGASLSLEGFYRDGIAFLVANGPSLKQLDLEPLRRRWVMTLNNGPSTFRGNANCTVDDPSRFSLSVWLDPTITKFVPLSHMEKPLWDNRLLRGMGGLEQRWEPTPLRVGDCPSVVGYRRNEKFFAPRWLTEETINWGNHQKYGGGRSVMLAALRILHVLGFRRIYLLGADFLMTGALRYHFEEGRTEAAVNNNMQTYAKLDEWFNELQPLFVQSGYTVKNCNPDSRLTAFPFCSYEQALVESQAHLGCYAAERTRGMYVRREEKLRFCQDSSDRGVEGGDE